MSTAGVKAGKAYVEIGTDNKKFEAGLKRAQAKLRMWGSTLQSLGTQIAGVGAAGTAAITANLATFSKHGDQLEKMALRTGISVEALSELQYAAGQSGSSIEALEKGVRRMQQGITEAATGTGAAKDAFAELGIEVAALARLSPEQQFLKITGQLADVEDATKKAALAMDIYGRAGTELLPMLADGNAGIEALRARAKALGLTMSTQAAKSAAIFGDNLADVLNQAKQVSFEIGNAVAPAIQALIVRVQSILKSVIDWTRANSEVILSALKIAAAVTAAGGAIVAIGLTIKAAAASIGILLGAIAAMKAAVAAVGSILAIAASPLALVTAGVVGLGVAFFDLGGIASQVGQYLSDVFKELKIRATAAFDGIKAAMAGGDIALAAKILWLAIKAEWMRGVEALTGVWVGFRDGFIDTWSSAVQFFAEAFITGIGLIKIAWADFAAFFQNVWNSASNSVGNFIDDWRTNIADGGVELINMLGLIDDAERNTRLQLSGQANQKQKDDRNAAAADTRAQIARDAEAARQAAVGQVQGQLGLLDQEAKAGRDQRARAAQETANRASAELAKAQKELADAIATAQANEGNNPTLPAAPARRAAAAAMEDGAAATVQARATTTGTFSARAAEAIGGTKPVVDAVKFNGQLLERIHRALMDQVGGLA